MDDAQIVQLYWDRNEQAIHATSDKYGNYCTSIAKNILGNQEDAEECVNDTYLNAWNAMPPHRPSILSTFLGKSQETCRLTGINTIPPTNGAVEKCLRFWRNFLTWYPARIMLSRHLTKRNSRKPLIHFGWSITKERSIFVSRYWYTDSISEIAVRHNMSDGAVSMALNRIRLKLHNYLLERGFEL